MNRSSSPARNILDDEVVPLISRLLIHALMGLSVRCRWDLELLSSDISQGSKPCIPDCLQMDAMPYPQASFLISSDRNGAIYSVSGHMHPFPCTLSIAFSLVMLSRVSGVMGDVLLLLRFWSDRHNPSTKNHPQTGLHLLATRPGPLNSNATF
ncbi:hypothetical protein K474DRAFT_623797 [Panus rudis PR-1116 ss-1]|nr:hypothetical protein K474DRAFT_623797 [Panus rudis PR-1116 ss-1]